MHIEAINDAGNIETLEFINHINMEYSIYNGNITYPADINAIGEAFIKHARGGR